MRVAKLQPRISRQSEGSKYLGGCSSAAAGGAGAAVPLGKKRLLKAPGVRAAKPGAAASQEAAAVSSSGAAAAVSADSAVGTSGQELSLMERLAGDLFCRLQI